LGQKCSRAGVKMGHAACPTSAWPMSVGPTPPGLLACHARARGDGHWWGSGWRWSQFHPERWGSAVHGEDGGTNGGKWCSGSLVAELGRCGRGGSTRVQPAQCGDAMVALGGTCGKLRLSATATQGGTFWQRESGFRDGAQCRGRSMARLRRVTKLTWYKINLTKSKRGSKDKQSWSLIQTSTKKM
jgi:hypothetical protein